MLEDCRVAVFDYFRQDDNWGNIKLDFEDVLFSCYVLKRDLKKHTIAFHRDVIPVKGIPKIEWRIITGGPSRSKTFWKGTDDERTLLVDGDSSRLSLVRYYHVDGKGKEENKPINRQDYDQYKHLEVTSLRVYPEFSERLYLCSVYNTNFDPLKEIAFGRPLGLECRTYLDIISGKVLLKKLGY